MGYTSFLVLLASSIYFISIDVCIHACNAYVSIDAKVYCGSAWQYRPSFSIKYNILSKPKLGSKQPESSELERKIRNYGRIVLFKAEYQAIGF